MAEKSHILSAYYRLPLELERGEGAYVFNASGNRYLDFMAGIAVNGLGHSHPHVVKTAREQIDTLWHVSNLFTVPDQERLASRLCEKTFADKVFFCSSGLEANEAAIKFIRKYFHAKGSKRYRIVTLERGFHGRSMATISAGGNAIAREGFGPLLEGFDQIPAENVPALERSITDETAAIMLEPVQAEGGIYPLSEAYLKQVRQLVDTHGLLVFFDEIQCGYGRTGSLFRYQQIGVTPDILTCGKGIGNGYPLAACLMTNAVAEAIKPGMHGSTYGGSPLAMAIGNAVLDVMEEAGFFDRVQRVSALLKDGLQALAAKFPQHIAQVRGEGMLLGVEVKTSAKDWLHKLVEAGLLVTRCGEDKVLRITPPLILTEAQAEEGLRILESVFR